MKKENIHTIHEKNEIINNILNAVVSRNSFLMIGHVNPDEDCIASMVAFALLVKKFDKTATVFTSDTIPENYQYLVNISRYNMIDVEYNDKKISRDYDTIVICDTPKTSMIHSTKKIDTLLNDDNVLKIEIDHHIGADSSYSGDRGYCLVTEASSASELIGQMALKLRGKRDVLSKYTILDPLSRNLVLAVLTGIIGDSKMGKYLKSRREKRMYRLFSGMYNDILSTVTVKETNFTDMEQIFTELQRLSESEENCYKYIMEKQQYTDSIGYILLLDSDVKYLKEKFDIDVIISVIRSVADVLAEKSGKVSLVVHRDLDENKKIIQCRMRRSHQYKKFDLRRIIDFFEIENGGGHEGAIGFRFRKKDIHDLYEYFTSFISKVEERLP